jgi:ubiquinone/menaquinone biosynthesis C-methylase UbiE
MNNMKIENVRKHLREKWNGEQSEYDSIAAHRINAPEEIELWRGILSKYPKSLRLLDIGVGTGFVSLIAAELGLNVTAVDWSESMMGQARSKAAERGLTIDFVTAATEELPFAENVFDIVVSRHVMWTLADPESAFRQWHKVLAPDGAAIADYSPITHGGMHGHHFDEGYEKHLPLVADVPAVQIENLFKSAGFSRVAYSTHKREVLHDDHFHAGYTFIFTCAK